MEIEQVNKKMTEAINKYNLEGHITACGGHVWFALCLQSKPATCINDHLKNKTYSFDTPRYTGNNADELHEIIIKHSNIIEEKLQALKSTV